MIIKPGVFGLENPTAVHVSLDVSLVPRDCLSPTEEVVLRKAAESRLQIRLYQVILKELEAIIEEGRFVNEA